MKEHKPHRNLQLDRLPQHLAFIMDGNGRWATKKGLPRVIGHQKGATTLKSIVEYAFSLHIPVVSVFAFSTENWKRPKQEVDAIFDLLRDFIKEFDKKPKNEQAEELKLKNIKLQILGDVSALPQDLAMAITNKCQETASNTGGTLNVALNYGGRADIVQACNKLLAQKRTVVTEQDFENALYTNSCPPIDFVIRTGGDLRLSNFMLYQLAYAELYFDKTYWPSFTLKLLDKALINYQKRKRKFGGI